MRPALAILAAGASQRLGQCKALVHIGEKRVLEHLLDAARSLASEPALVVTGAHHTEISACPELAGRAVEWLENPNWELGRTGGIALAYAHRPGRDLLLAPVDCPLVPARVFDALADEWARVGAPARGWLAPRFYMETGQARFGHPVILGRDLLAEISSALPDAPLRDVRNGADPLLALDVDAIEVLDDLDTPEDLDFLAVRGR